jgi:hypothetical protein
MNRVGDDHLTDFERAQGRGDSLPELCGPVAVTAGGGAEDTFQCVLDEGHAGEHLFAEEWDR